MNNETSMNNEVPMNSDTVFNGIQELTFSETNSYFSDFDCIDNKNHFINQFSTGIPQLDEFLNGGIEAGFGLLAGGSNVGKTTFLLQLATSMAITGQPVFLFSLEQPREVILAKALSKELYINGNLPIKADEILFPKKATNFSGTVKKIYSEVVAPYLDAIKDNLFIFDSDYFMNKIEKTPTVLTIDNMVQRYKNETGRMPIIFIDYFQILLTGIDSIDSNEIAQTSMNASLLSKLAHKYKIPVVAIASLNKEACKKGFVMESIRGSGQVPYTADWIMSIQFEGQYSKDFELEVEKCKEIRNIEIIKSKQRLGTGAGRIKCKFHAPYNYFKFDDAEIELKSLPQEPENENRLLSAFTEAGLEVKKVSHNENPDSEVTENELISVINKSGCFHELDELEMLCSDAEKWELADSEV